MNDLSVFITDHPYFSVFLAIVALCMVGAIADGIKGRSPKCGPCAACRVEQKKAKKAT